MSGNNLAILGSKPTTTSVLINEVETNHQKIRFNKYLAPDRE